MTTGIYLLNFDNQAYYIGQSQDIESRGKQHADKLIKGKHAAKMQHAYDHLGMPNISIVVECHKDYLDILENYYIHDQKKYVNCLNTSAPALDLKIDYPWLLERVHVLKHSSVDILTALYNTTTERDDLQLSYDKVKQEFNKAFIKEKATTELRDGKDLNAKLVLEYHKSLTQAEQKIHDLLNRGLLARVFNHQ